MSLSSTSTLGGALDSRRLASLIDHTILRPQATEADILALCDEARAYQFGAVCIHPVFVRAARERLDGSAVKVCTVAGFPLGADVTPVKVEAARRALADGAVEVDMVIFIGGLKGGQFDAVRDDMAAVADTCHAGGAKLKVIFENSLLSEEEKAAACELSIAAGVDFVKTSTGFSTGGATVRDVERMSRLVKPRGLGVKAAGGIRTLADARAMIAAGATRLGASASVTIMKEILASEED
jgi:deoxyribose-phosphate aldolase